VQGYPLRVGRRAPARSAAAQTVQRCAQWQLTALGTFRHCFPSSRAAMLPGCGAPTCSERVGTCPCCLQLLAGPLVSKCHPYRHGAPPTAVAAEAPRACDPFPSRRGMHARARQHTSSQLCVLCALLTRAKTGGGGLPCDRRTGLHIRAAAAQHGGDLVWRAGARRNVARRSCLLRQSRACTRGWRARQ
jgi:hypothetical protein